jgi:hypothetical protein
LFYARRELLAMLDDEPTLASLWGDLAVDAASSAPSDGDPAKEPA